MTSLTIANADPILKTLYKPGKLEDATYRARPLLAMLPKWEGFGGRNKAVPLRYGNPQGRSAAFATAQANRTQSRFEDYLVTRVNDYSIAAVDGETVDATKGDDEAFISGLAAQIDGAVNALSDAHETFLFGTGSGAIGQISSGSVVTTGTITLSDINDVTNFEVGMTLVAAATETGAVRTGTEVLAGVDRSAGTLDSTSTAWDDVITAIAADDFLFVEGDAQNGGSAVKISGLGSWVPASAPSATLFFGVDRTSDIVRLGGNRTTQTGISTEDAFINGQSIASREGAMIDVIVCNNIKYRRLVKELGSKVEYDKLMAQGAKGEKAHFGFKALVLDGDTGPVKVVSANKCPSNESWGLQLDTWTLGSIGPAVKFLMDDGLKILRQSSADGYEVRIGFRGQLMCNRPGYNIHMTLDTE